MTGIFQLVDRYKALAGRKNGSKKSEKTKDPSIKDPSRIPGYYMFQDKTVRRRHSLDSSEQPKACMEVSRDPRRTSIDNTEVLLARSLAASKESQPLVHQKLQPGRTSLDTRRRPLLPFYVKDETQVSSDTPKATKKAAQTSFSRPLQREPSKTAPVLSRASVDGRTSMTEGPKPPSRDIRGFLKAAFHREKLRVSGDNSKDPQTAAVNPKKAAQAPDQGKYLPEISDSAKGGTQLSLGVPSLNVIKVKDHLSVDSKELPRSFVKKNVGSPRILVDGQHVVKLSETFLHGKEGVKLSVDPGRLTVQEKDQLLVDGRELPRSLVKRNVRSPRNLIDRKDVATLTQSSGESPRLSASKGGLRVSVRSTDLPRHSSVKEVGRDTIESSITPSPVHDFREFLRTLDSRDSSRSLEKNRDASRHSVHGRDPLRASVSTRLSVDSRAEPHQSHTPRLSTDGRDSLQVSNPCASRYSLHDSIIESLPQARRENSFDSIGAGETRWRAPSVVARLMGLQELPSTDSVPPSPTVRPSSREGKSLHKLLNSAPPVEASLPASDHYHLQSQWNEGFLEEKKVPKQVHKDSQSKSDSSLHAAGQQEGVPHSRPTQRQLDAVTWQHKVHNAQNCTPQKLPMSPKHHLNEGMPTALKHPDNQNPSREGFLCGDMDQRLLQLHIRNSIQERKTLKQILEAMHLKGLLHPPQHKQLKDHKLDVLTTEMAVEEGLPLWQKNKLAPSSIAVPFSELKKMDQEYRDVLKFRSASETMKKDNRVQNEGALEVDGSKSSMLDSQLQIVNPATGKASIVVMKPLNLKSATASSQFPLLVRNKDSASVPSWVSSSLGAARGPAHAGIDREDLSSSSNWGTSKFITSKAGNKGRSSRSQSQDSLDQHSIQLGTAMRLSRRERIAAQTVKVASEVGEFRPWESNPRAARSISPPMLRDRASMARGTKSGSLGTTTFGSTSSQMTEGGRAREKPEKSTLKVREETKATLGSLQSQPSGGILEGRASNNHETSRVPSRTRSDHHLVMEFSENPVLLDPSLNSAHGGRIPAEVSILRTKRTTGRAKNSVDRSKELPATGKISSENSEVTSLYGVPEDYRHQLDKARSKDLILEIVPDIVPMVTFASAPVTWPDSPRPIVDMVFEEKASQVVEQIQEPHIVVLPESYIQVSESCSNNSGPEDALSSTTSGQHSIISIPSTRHQEAEVAANEADERELSKVLSPEGLSVMKPAYSQENTQMAAVFEHPSPVSVLDKGPFQAEECIPSLEAEKVNVICYEGMFHANDTKTTCNPAVFVDGHAPHTPTTTAPEIIKENTDPLTDLSSKVTHALELNDQELHIEKSTLEGQAAFGSDIAIDKGMTALGSSFQNKEEERAYVQEILIMSGCMEETSSCDSKWPASGYAIDPTCFARLDDRLQRQECIRAQNGQLMKSPEKRLREAVNRRALFDSISDVLERKLYRYLNPQPWSMPTLCKRPVGQQLLQEIWDELQEMYCPLTDDYDALQAILKNDLAQKGTKWLDFGVEIGEVSCALEKMIFEDMLEVAARDLISMSTEKPSL